MLSEPKTLYKLMCLYMLKKVQFPLTNSQLTDFFLDNEYTTYFTLQEVLNELLDSGLICMHSQHNTSRYDITKEGEDTLEFFGKNISPAIVADMDNYLKDNNFRIRNEAGIISDYYKSTNQDYIAHFEIHEGKSTLLDLSIAVPDEGQAEYMCDQWEKKNQDIYSMLMKALMSSNN